MVALRLFEVAALEKLRHAEDGIERSPQLMADVRDEPRSETFARLCCIAQQFGQALLLAQPGDQFGIILTKMDAVVEQLRDRAAIPVENAAEEKHQIGGQHLIQ